MLCYAQVEVRDGGGVDIFGLKSEGQFAVLWLRNATRVNMFGYGGNACPFEGTYPPGFAPFPPSLFRLQESSQVTLASLISWDMSTTLRVDASAPSPVRAPRGQLGDVVRCADPDRWVAVFETFGGRNFSTAPLDRPALYRRT